MRWTKPRNHSVTPLVVAVLWLPGLAASAAVPASARELGGIRLGMTMEELKAAAVARQPPLTLEKPETAPIPGQPGKTFPVSLKARSYAGQQPSDFEEFDITFSAPPLVPRVVRINHLAGSSEAKAPSKARLQKTLRDKFGGPPARGYPGWVWRADGTPARADEAENCLIGHDSQGTWLRGYDRQPQVVLERIKDTSTTCGLVAVASPRDPRLVSITITDFAALAEALAKGIELVKGAPAAAGPAGTPR